MYDINVVANYSTIVHFKNLPEFKLDLGKGLIDHETKSINVKDNFLAFQMYKLNRMVYKIGVVGKVGFYYDNRLKNNIVEIFSDMHKFEKTLDTPDVDTWLANQLLEANEVLKEKENENSTN